MKDQLCGSAFAEIAAGHVENIAGEFPKRREKVPFVESKKVDLGNVAVLLEHCRSANQWANRGPLYRTLADAYHDHMALPGGIAVTPCANGGVGLEALARFHDRKLGRPLSWVVSAFSFANLGRGWFAGARVIDCDERGMLDLEALRAIDPKAYDGIVVTNVSGLWQDFAPYAAFARETGKAMLIDNAAGIDERVPDWPYQAFSLHHTKPYGAGEGGLLTSPRDEAEAIYALLNYGPVAPGARALWFNNGKLSDIACAFHLDRLASRPDWAPRYREQADRVDAIAVELGLAPLIAEPRTRPAMSRPYLAAHEIPLSCVQSAPWLVCGKYYQPLAPLPRAQGIYPRLVNLPTHPGVDALSDDQLRDCIAEIMQ